MRALTRITSKDNANIKEISGLQKSSKHRRDQGVFVLEGLRLCLDAIENGFIPKKVFLSTSAISKYPEAVEKFLQYDEVYEVSDSLFSKISDTVNPQGILCLFNIPFVSIDKINNKGKYIALENIQDPSNLGAISRTAEAFGISGLILTSGCADPYSSKSLRASMGALLRIPVYQVEDLFELFETKSLTSFAAVVNNNAKSINEISFSAGSVAIIGNEANGICEESISKSDCKFTIPMNGRAESLNAAVAASIIIWEMCKC